MAYIKTGKCIWCGHEKPEATFNNRPHVIQKSLLAPYIGFDICDDCNKYFGEAQKNVPAIDFAFKEIFNASRFFDKDLNSTSYKDFKSKCFRYKHSQNRIIVKDCFSPTIITEQFKRGLFEVFLQYYHYKTYDGNNPIFDPVRKYARYNQGKLQVYYLVVSYVMKASEKEHEFLLPMSEKAIDDIFTYGIYRFFFEGHFFYLEIIPELFSTHHNDYFKHQESLMVLPYDLSGKIIELTNIMDVDFFMQKLHKRNINL